MSERGIFGPSLIEVLGPIQMNTRLSEIEKIEVMAAAGELYDRVVAEETMRMLKENK